MRRLTSLSAIVSAGALCVACTHEPSASPSLGTPSFSARGAGSVLVVNVSRDTTAQNETPWP